MFPLQSQRLDKSGESAEQDADVMIDPAMRALTTGSTAGRPGDRGGPPCLGGSG
jgi:hypothetical protein